MAAAATATVDLSTLLPLALASLSSTIAALPDSTVPGPLSSDIFERLDESPSVLTWPTLATVFDSVYSSFTAKDVRAGEKGVGCSSVCSSGPTRRA